MKTHDIFGERMKMYEKLQQQSFMPKLPICVRIDGRTFSTWTKLLQRPYDTGMMEAMKALTIALVKETQACIGYTQSDEVSLIICADRANQQPYFNGKIQKIISSIAAFASAWFNMNINTYMKDSPYSKKLATFDCRAWQVPSKMEAVNTLLWREQDATKNSISMAASSVYSHKQLMNKNGKHMQDMLFDKGINWNDYPAQFKRGVFIQRTAIIRKFNTDELALLPAKHQAHTNTELTVKRIATVAVAMPPFGTVTNKVDVVFNGATPTQDTK